MSTQIETCRTPAPPCGCTATKSRESHPVIDSAAREALLCSECFDALGCSRIISMVPMSLCGCCGRRCLGYATEIPAPVDSVSRLREVEERSISALASLCEAENRYRIEKPIYAGSGSDLSWCWSDVHKQWLAHKALATIYTEAERTASLALHNDGQRNGFPDGGQWVVLDPLATIECDGCETVVRDATARLLAEAVYALDWLVMTNGVMCKSCQVNNGAVSEEDARVDEADVLEGD